MAWSTPDLSDITQVLRGMIETSVTNSTLHHAHNIKVLCDSPDTARTTDGFCHLNIYLLHVGRDPFWRNTPVQGPRPQLNSAQPLSLNLSYLLTAWCDKDFALEQRAMSIALQTIHANPIVTQTLITAESLQQWLPEGEFIISIEADTIEEMSRLWQAFTVPMRLSALVRASVIFLQPQLPITPPASRPSATNISVAPQPFEPPPPTPPDPPLLIGGYALQSPPVDPHESTAVTQAIGPLVGVGGNPALAATEPQQALGSTLAVLGNGLTLPAAASLFMSVPGIAGDWDITSWITTTSAGEIDIQLPSAYAAPGSTAPFPATQTPLPGLYNLAVGTGAATRSNTIQLAIAPRVDGVTDPPKLTPSGTGLFTITGAGFQPNATTKLTLGGTALTYTGTAPPAAGEFTVDATGATITFVAPTALTTGHYPVLLTVDGIAATSSWVAAVS